MAAHNCICEIHGKVSVECCDFTLAHNPLGECLPDGFRKLAAQTVHLSSCDLSALPTLSARCEVHGSTDNISAMVVDLTQMIERV